ncbi:metalloendopeptidase [Vanrija albida]|uniref:Metalloendopeptidase n=1 Tax=Vanrija albida TaxID=181172 RepID=A0ABR3PVK7_9TREE
MRLNLVRTAVPIARGGLHRAPRVVVPAFRRASPSSVLAHTKPFHSSGPSQRRYERWEEDPWSGQPNERPDVMSFLRRRLGGDRAVWLWGIGIGACLIYYCAHLERVPITGRLRFIDVSPQAEREVGQESFAQTLQEFQGKILPPGSPVVRRVRDICERIVASNGLGHVKAGGSALGAVEGVLGAWGATGTSGSDDDNYAEGDSEGRFKGSNLGPDTEWDVYVVQAPDVKNAFVLPNGKIFVFTGILPVSANDNGLATVLGHEISHVVARHGAERMSSMKVLFAISFLLEALGLDVGITRALVTFMLMLPNSRKNEAEADEIGLQLMAQACFDPTEAPKLWERMSEGEGVAGKFDFMSTHPASQKRIRNLEKEQPQALEIRAKHCGYTEQQYGSFTNLVGKNGQGGQTSQGVPTWG